LARPSIDVKEQVAKFGHHAGRHDDADKGVERRTDINNGRGSRRGGCVKNPNWPLKAPFQPVDQTKGGGDRFIGTVHGHCQCDGRRTIGHEGRHLIYLESVLHLNGGNCLGGLHERRKYRRWLREITGSEVHGGKSAGASRSDDNSNGCLVPRSESPFDAIIQFEDQ
jgi:hypothetical protein